ncbi:flagellar filament capping protein FliD [Actinoplanes sp. NBRC 103695]|uniref:flagellar filament capping protein FliD n=1 Tax=Actinoplanes sp. NBRC 103695 TaxID=3032202 RepID=UPI0024A4F442|nr:flagellar filament capping protein FliD [Actinoplanes sp. NBRC 103695]GLY96859.1 lateral flagellar hook-associated protein 2 [Actinoplanes sp. NBRC 103695]
MGTTVDGLVSGMSTSSMIGQLMQIEALPQTRLKSKVSSAESVVTAYQSVNTKLAALKTAGNDLSQLSTWRSIKPASTSTAVTAAATPGVTSPQTGSLTFDVARLAKAQISTTRVDSGADITSSDTFTITIGTGDPVTIDLAGKRTAQDVSDAVNSAGIGVKSSVVKTSTGDSVLQFTSSKTGEANAFTIDGTDFALQTAVAAQDAMLQVGGADEDGGYSVTSSSNTFTNLMNGVTLTATKQEQNVTVDVGADISGMADKIKAMVDAANAVLSEVTKQTKYDATTKKGSALSADFMVRQISQNVLSAVSQGQTDIGSLSKLGVQLEKDGTLSFKKEAFEASYNADPDKFTDAGIAFGNTMEALAKKQTTNVTNAVTGRKSLIDSMNDQIDNWDVRLEQRRTTLTKQYAALETALSSLKSQSSYLSSQLG